MTRHTTPVGTLWLLSAAILCVPAAAQSIGTLKTESAEITGLVTVSNGRATIGNRAAVTAGAQPAEIALRRGGSVKVCSGSAMHLSQPSLGVQRPPLMLALDRGAAEIRTSAEKTDAILTPDLRLELSNDAPLDLHLRVVPNGDTCIDNAGKDGPVLHVTATFGNGAYFIRPGQRVLFEHGSLREVVDHEGSSCGCPRPEDGKRNGKLTEAAKNNPFPEAVSQGLQKPEVPASTAPVGETKTQVSSTLSYSGETGTVSGPPGQTTTAADVAQATTPSSPPVTPAGKAQDDDEQHSGFFGSIGNFFRRLFGGH